VVHSGSGWGLPGISCCQRQLSPTAKHDGTEICRKYNKKGRDGDSPLETEGLKQTAQNDREDLLLWPPVNESQQLGHIQQPEKSAHGYESDPS
jgi:hypothetical protein